MSCQNDKKPIVTINYFIVDTAKMVTANDVNAYTFTNTGTTQAIVQGETIFPNQSLVFSSNCDCSLDMSQYEISFPFVSPQNRILVRTRKVRFV